MVEFFFYCRDRPGTLDLRLELLESHWSFMDGYAASMIARGPTLTEDGETPTGSVHIVDLPDAAAAHTFAYAEPNYRAGVYGDVLVRRFVNTLGRTMWEFRGDGPRFLVLGHARTGAPAPGELVPAAYADRLIGCGPLLSDDGATWLGTAILVQLPDRAAVAAMMAPSRAAYAQVEIHPWRFGGRG